MKFDYEYDLERERLRRLAPKVGDLIVYRKAGARSLSTGTVTEADNVFIKIKRPIANPRGRGRIEIELVSRRREFIRVAEKVEDR